MMPTMKSIFVFLAAISYFLEVNRGCALLPEPEKCAMLKKIRLFFNLRFLTHNSFHLTFHKFNGIPLLQVLSFLHRSLLFSSGFLHWSCQIYYEDSTS
ncbi:uncharacterized protein EV420DRAFT_1580478 [Desarmillaria tabescens]|uniref:Secreted protein n=1 Tax=Armillaria tabescens TaxID=1929756 RepID=A0AA39JGB0_ARMTA|nr:uncharacterized protein EV420DRAFT_1580478 [Desarmillaria tabescens]KAK0441251.1 hypothetical protein EV420DRAFT_1580478 [Desarmillaria tabescens]